MLESPLTKSVWPKDESEPLVETTVGDLLRSVAGEVPDRRALVECAADPAKRRTWTYRELLKAVEQVSSALLTRFTPGEHVAIWGPNSAEWVLFQQGAILAGLTLVTINPAYRQQELEYVIRQSRSAGKIHAPAYRGYDMAAAIKGVQDTLPDLREVMPFADWDALLASGVPSHALPPLSPTGPVQLQYTSGTTGAPKGAMLHHRGMVNSSRFVADRVGLDDGVVWVSAMPMFHIGGALAEMGVLNNRGTFVLLPEFEPGRMLEAIETYKAGMVLAVPTMLIAMLDHADAHTRDLSSLRTVMSGASVVSADLVRRTKATFGCDFTIIFGQTELHGVLTQTLLTDSPDDQADTIGRPLPQVEVMIADETTGEPQPIGQKGEICARGYQTMHGYFDMPEPTAQTIRPDGWLRMGDLGTMDERGYLRITDRIKDVIIRGGENIYPREIEDMLFAHPQVAQVAVIGVPDEKWGERVAAVVVPADPANPPSAEELRAYCRENFAAYKTPTDCFFVSAFPLTPNGQDPEVRPPRADRGGDTRRHRAPAARGRHVTSRASRRPVQRDPRAMRSACRTGTTVSILLFPRQALVRIFCSHPPSG